jgi:hypothetical protein
MTIRFTLVTQNDMLGRLVREFAEGLGWTVEDASASLVTVVQPDGLEGAEHLVRLLTYVALCAAKAGVDPSEPICRVRYREGKAGAEVSLGLRIAEFHMRAA